MRLWCCGICTRCAHAAELSSNEQSFQMLTSFLSINVLLWQLQGMSMLCAECQSIYGTGECLNSA